ncbi:hypothetical protein [Bacteroides pyogenes]|uniref:hypothetical protein n=1 Tax=Bacteroides pyogenes TaxID=310300 RepID=UPI001BAE3CD6|nr:hypothetical protein [Bacteroides pyogenes]MBR8704733.1 hypothetical protein [Bacteroides pyogenes]
MKLANHYFIKWEILKIVYEFVACLISEYISNLTVWRADGILETCDINGLNGIEFGGICKKFNVFWLDTKMTDSAFVEADKHIIAINDFKKQHLDMYYRKVGEVCLVSQMSDN